MLLCNLAFAILSVLSANAVPTFPHTAIDGPFHTLFPSKRRDSQDTTHDSWRRDISGQGVDDIPRGGWKAHRSLAEQDPFQESAWGRWTVTTDKCDVNADPYDESSTEITAFQEGVFPMEMVKRDWAVKKEPLISWIMGGSFFACSLLIGLIYHFYPRIFARYPWLPRFTGRPVPAPVPDISLNDYGADNRFGVTRPDVLSRRNSAKITVSELAMFQTDHTAKNRPSGPIESSSMSASSQPDASATR